MLFLELSHEVLVEERFSCWANYEQTNEEALDAQCNDRCQYQGICFGDHYMQGAAGQPFLLSDEDESRVVHLRCSGWQDWSDTIVPVEGLPERLRWDEDVSQTWLNRLKALVTLLWHVAFDVLLVPAIDLTGNEFFEVLCRH